MLDFLNLHGRIDCYICSQRSRNSKVHLTNQCGIDCIERQSTQPKNTQILLLGETLVKQGCLDKAITALFI